VINWGCDIAREACMKKTAQDPQGPKEKKAPRTGRLDKKRFGAEQVGQNIRQQRSLGREVDRLVEDTAKLAREERGSSGASRQGRRWLERQKDKFAGRELRLRERDDKYVEDALKRKAPLEGAFNAEGATDVDDLLYVMESDLKVFPLLEALSPPNTYENEKTGETTKARFMYPSLTLNLVSLISRYLSAVGGPEIMSVVLTDPRYMGLLSFTLEEVQAGATQRSAGLTGKTRTEAGGKFEDAGEAGPVRNSGRPEGYRGAFSSQTVAGHEAKLEPQALEDTMNGLVRAVARRGLLPPKVLGVLDSTGEESVPTCEGAGKVRKKVKVASKSRRPRAMEVTVKGFKLWVLMDADTGIPLAIRFATIEKPENHCVREIVLQAKENLKGYCKLVGLAVDRGFLDGDFLYWAKQEQGIDWVCPAKEKMLVTQEARDRVVATLRHQRQGNEDPLETASRLAGRSYEKHDGVSFFEANVGPGRQPLLLAGVDDLYDTDFYGPGGAASSRVNSKSYRPTALHATVVLNWPDRAHEDKQDEEEHDRENKGPVVLLSPIPEAANNRFHRYDQRSLIENRVNRDAKQHHGLGSTLVRTMAGMRTATYFSIMALLLFRVLEIRMQEAEDRRAENLGLKRYRRKLKVETRNKLIIYVDGKMGMLYVWDVLKLGGVEFA
jgi:Transposase DDE domain